MFLTTFDESLKNILCLRLPQTSKEPVSPMNYICEISKEYPSLPQAELLSCFYAENITYTVLQKDNGIIIVQSLDLSPKKLEILQQRLALTFVISECIFYCAYDYDLIRKQIAANPINIQGTIAIEYTNKSTHKDIQDIIQVIQQQYTKNRIVNLSNPDIRIRIIITDNFVYVGVPKAKINRSQFEKRKVQHRPFFSPISLHPKLARALVNLAGVSSQNTLFDPFCGTGGIILEGGLIGMHVIGSDIEQKMIDGCRKTLSFYGILNVETYCMDIGEIKEHIHAVDAVVTDLPYGKSTTTKKEDIHQLYSRAFKSIHAVLKPGGKAVVGCSDKSLVSCADNYLLRIDEHKVRVHRSLTRYFIVYIR